MNPENKVSIILTTTVHVTENSAFQVNKMDRINTYLKSIHLWLKKTDFNIIVVENSGYSFEELENELKIYKGRFEIHTYNEADIKKNKGRLMHLESKGGCEIESIHYAYNNSAILQLSTFIIKITGRFFIPDFKEYIHGINLENYDCLKQNFDFRCEIVGSHKKNFDTIFNRNLFINNGIYDWHVENVYAYRFSLYKNVLVCPIFDIEPTPRGGLNEIYYQL